MLPPFIIEQIRKRESEERREQPRLELPLEPMRPPASGDPRPPNGDESERGVIILDLLG